VYELTSFSKILLVILFLWTIPWKVYALWTAAKRDDKKWFVVLIIINTVGILEIIYIFKIVKKSGAEVKNAFRGAWNLFKQTIGNKK